MLDYSMPVRVLSEQDLLDAGCFDMDFALSVAQDAFIKYAQGDVIFPEKVSVVFDQVTQNRINCLPAAIKSEKVYGMKWVSVFPGNPHKLGKANLTAVYILSELESGYPIAFMEGSLCSNLRTAAVGGLAAKYLARSDAKVIGFIGAGEQAKAHLLAMKAACPALQKCYVASRTTSSEDLFVTQMRRFCPGMIFEKCSGDHKKAVAQADIIVTAISGQEKILQAEWIKDGAFYCHVAGLEDDFSVAQKAGKIVCDNWEAVKHRTQTISQMYQMGLLQDSDIYADLHEIITQKKPGRENPSEFIYFNSVGMSFVDTLLAYRMFQKCVQAGIGPVICLKERSMFDKDACT